MINIKHYNLACVVLLNGFFCSNAYATCPPLGSTLYAPSGISSDTNCVVSVSGGNFGIVVNSGSQYTSINGTVSTVGNGGYGVTVLGNNSSFTAHGLVVTTTGSYVPSHYALGMLIQTNVNVTIDDRMYATRASSTRTSGNGSSAIVVSPNSRLSIFGAEEPVFIGTSGANANGIQMETGTLVTTDNLNVEITGNNGQGINMYYTTGLASSVYQGSRNTIR